MIVADIMGLAFLTISTVNTERSFLYGFENRGGKSGYLFNNLFSPDYCYGTGRSELNQWINIRKDQLSRRIC